MARKAADAAIGAEVAAAVRDAGLPVVWDGSAGQRIEVTPLDWKHRVG